MEHTGLLVDLALALGAAWAGALVATLLRQSTILGFILGGLAIGPNTPGLVGDLATVEELANIGLILLMFSIGVHVSLRELRAVGAVVIGGAAAQLFGMIALGAGVGVALGWDTVEALFFGSVVAISSGAVLSRILEDRGDLGTVFGRIALGWSVVQDLATVVLVVVLGALASGGGDVGIEVLQATGKALLFLAIVVPAGSRALPWLFERIAALRSRELFILTTATVALGTAWASSLFGLSLALGAFVAGVVVSESELSHQVLGYLEPLRDIFAGLFFVSIGMLVDPAFVLEHLPLVLLALALIVIVKGAAVAGLTLAFGHSLRTAVTVGVLLSQAGEFSFLLARLGRDEEAVSSDVFNLMVTATVCSIVLTAPLLGQADRAGRWLEPRRMARRPDRDLVEIDPPPHRHVVICGYGRVGRIVGESLRRRGITYLVIEEDQAIVRELREQGIPALRGYAELPALLDRARVKDALVLVIAIPDALAVRRIVDYARHVDRRLPIVARTHSENQRRDLTLRGVNEAVVGEIELAIEMTRFTLQRSGIDTVEVETAVRRLRRRAGAVASFDD